MISKVSLDDVQVGQWYYQCCHLDLCEVQEDDVEWIKNNMYEDAPYVTIKVLKTKLDALLYIRKRTYREDDIAEVNAMLEELG